MRYPYLRDDSTRPVDLEVVDDGLRFVSPEGASNTVRWANIDRIQLYCRPQSRGDLLMPIGACALYCCRISVREKGDIILTCPNDSAASFALKESYRSFVGALHQRMLVNASTSVDLRIGIRVRWFILAGLLTWPTGVIVATIVTLFGRRPAPGDFNRALWWANLPARYHPGHIPERALPPLGGA